MVARHAGEDVGTAAAMPAPAGLGRLAWDLYAGVPAAARWMMRYRPAIAPFDAVLSRVAPGSRVLDVGCGAGLLLNLLGATGRLGEGVGFDLSEKAVSAARAAALRHGRPTTFVRLNEADAWPDGGFDAVTVVDLLHHLRPERHAEVVRRAAERVGPGGRLIVKDMDGTALVRPWFSRLHDLVLARQWIWFPKPAVVIAAAEGAGLRLVERKRIDMLWYGHEMMVFEQG